MQQRHLFLLATGVIQTGLAANVQGPTFSCKKVEAGSIESMVCQDQELSTLDRQLATVYSAALPKARNEHPPLLKAEQRGWIKGRNDCWKSSEQRNCVRDEYQHRIAELQAKYRLVAATGPVIFQCNGQASNEVQATYFATKPLTLIAERGDDVSLMFLQESGSGTKYQGRNESLWEHQGEAQITWGYGTPEMHCRKKQ